MRVHERDAMTNSYLVVNVTKAMPEL